VVLLPRVFSYIYMNFHIVTLFPNAFDSYIGESIIKRAIEDKKIRINFYDPKDFADPAGDGKMKNKKGGVFRKRIDDKAYGGGPGMVIQALPTIKAIEKAISVIKKGKGKKSSIKIIFLSPSGKQFDNSYAAKTAKNTQMSSLFLAATKVSTRE
jgi:tRNA (guanine37-N1)-methyltransferase